MKTIILITLLLLFISLVSLPVYSEPFPAPLAAPRGPRLPPRPLIQPPPLIIRSPLDLPPLQKQYQELRSQRDRLEKEIDLSVVRIRQLKIELKNAENPLSKYFYRRQIEIQFSSFQNKIEQLGSIETQLTDVIHELSKRIVGEPGSKPGRPLVRGPYPVFPQSGGIPPLPRPPVPVPDVDPLLPESPLTFPPGFDRWAPAEKAQFIQTQIIRITEEKKQLERTIKQHNQDLTRLKKMNEEIQYQPPGSPE